MILVSSIINLALAGVAYAWTTGAGAGLVTFFAEAEVTHNSD